MARYIDADALQERLRVYDWYRDGRKQGVGFVIDYSPPNTPTADVQEVKHGKWKQIYEKYPRYVCTVCDHLFNNKSFKFCPNCGARMDGESE